MTLTENDLEALMREVKKSVSRYLHLEDADDLLSEAYFAAWSTARLMEEDQRTQLYPWCCQTAIFQVKKFLKSRRRLHPLKAPDMVSLETLQESWMENDEFEWFFHPSSPDFAPGLIDRLAGGQLIEEVLSFCNPKQRYFIRRNVLRGESLETISEEVGLKKSTIHDHIQRGLDEYRYRIGIPAKKSVTLRRKQGLPAGNESRIG